jgi:NADP-dependent 3-hydroxy acid dehydrogenase YdfG
MIKLMPKLKPQDVADAVLYAISTPENVLVIN